MLNLYMNWIKRNWPFVAIVIFLILLFGRSLPQSSNSPSFSALSSKSGADFGLLKTESSSRVTMDNVEPSPDYAPSDSSNRLVSQNASLSLHVKDVPQTIKDIQSQAESLGGFLVNSSLSKPESAATGYISVRVPSEKLQEAISAFKSLGIKTVSESITGTDLTDQYEDLETRLSLLENIKAKYQSILSSATAVSDILEVQRELINTQSQIDSIKGQQDYLQKTAALSMISVYLSTDELSLPYTPDQSWRPQVVFKQAVRSLVSSFRSIANFTIKAFVFIPIWLPLLLAYLYFKKRRNRSLN